MRESATPTRADNLELRQSIISRHRQRAYTIINSEMLPGSGAESALEVLDRLIGNYGRLPFVPACLKCGEMCKQLIELGLTHLECRGRKIF